MQVKLLAGGQVGDEGVYPVKLPVIDGNLPINTPAVSDDACKLSRAFPTNGFLSPLDRTLSTSVKPFLLFSNNCYSVKGQGNLVNGLVNLKGRRTGVHWGPGRARGGSQRE